MFAQGTGAAAWRRLFAAAAALITAATVLLAPPAPPRLAANHRPSTQLTAAALPLLPDALDTAPTSAQAFDFADAAQLLAPAAATGFAGFIQSLYVGAEQWVRYGVNLTAWLVGWVPLVGLLAPQINIFYDLGESMVRSTVFNTTDWLSGTIGFGQALTNIGSETAAAFDDFFTAQQNWIRHFLPPAPPIFPSAEAAAALDPGITPGIDLDGLVPDGLNLLP